LDHKKSKPFVTPLGQLIHTYYIIIGSPIDARKRENAEQERHPVEGEGKSRSSQEDSSLLVHRDVGISLSKKERSGYLRLPDFRPLSRGSPPYVFVQTPMDQRISKGVSLEKLNSNSERIPRPPGADCRVFKGTNWFCGF
jgi:hypothetical protein